MDLNAEQKLAILAKIADLVANGEDPAAVLNSVLALLSHKMRLIRSAIALVNPETGQIRIEAAWGMAPEQQKRGEYLRGEGITGQVVSSGEPRILPNPSREPGFLNRTQSRSLGAEDISFLCLPLKLGSQTIGALLVDLPMSGETELRTALDFLKLAAAFLANVASRGRSIMTSSTNLTNSSGFVGSSDAIRQLLDQIALVAPSHTSVLLQGESGVGKELAAKAIHKGSPRVDRPFVAINCAALPETLIESELFGHERGAFTGAAQMRRGRFEQANGGTLFLDEIGELSLLVQAKLLRVLQEGTFARVGGMESLSCDVRIIAATNRDLAKMVELGSFRRDLFYRLNVFPISLPPLRERKEDILPLANHFLEKFAKIDNASKPGLALETMTLLESYDWPGNVRELQNVMERASILAGHEKLILPGHLPAELCSSSTPNQPRGEGQNAAVDLAAKVEELERTAIVNALACTGGHMGNAAAMLHLTCRVLGLRMAKYGLNYKNYRNNSSQLS